MHRNAILLTLTALVACAEVPQDRLFDFWESLGEAGDSFDTEETGSSSGAAFDDDGAYDSGDGDPGDDDTGNNDPGDGDGDGDGEEGDDDTCVAVSEAAHLVQNPADIIFIVDNSDGMTEEAVFVQTQLNGFAAQLEMADIDHHVVLISEYPKNGNGICINPPLGSGSCPDYDDNLPVYHHVDQKVGKHNARAKLISTHHQWKDSIRPGSAKHIVVISDDESDLGPNPFDSLFLALDPDYDPYVFHAIVCPWDCAESNAVGQVYVDLVNQTGGVLGDLCQQDFQTVFEQVANAVTQSVPKSCQFEIPAPPMGMTFDPNLINVELDDGNNNLEEVPRVDDFADCMNYPEGWYYDDPADPAQIFMCPQACTKAQGYVMGAINVKFGCETLSS